MDIVQALATTTEAPRDKDMAMEAITRGPLHLAMDTVESATITEAPKVSKDMDIIRGLQLLSLDMALLMSMLSRRIMDMDTLSLMSMDTIFTRGLLMLSLDMALLMSMLSRRTMDMDTLSLMSMDTIFTRDLLMLSPDMDLLMSMLSRRIMDMDIPNPMSMDITSIRDPLMLDTMAVLTLRSTRAVPTTTDLMAMRLITMARGPLMLDMNPTKVTRKFPTPHTPTMRSKCTTLTKCQIEIVPELLIYVNDSYFIRIKI